MLKIKTINDQIGFTLIEVLVVISITVFISIVLMNGILRSNIDLENVGRSVVADIRTAQTNSLNSKKFTDGLGVTTYRCGYGIRQVNNSSYYLFTGREPNSSGVCPGNNDFGNVSNTPIVKTVNIDSRLELFDQAGPSDGNFFDIYFKSPSGQVFIGGQSIKDNGLVPTDNRYKSVIKIRKIGATCPSSDCIYVCVYANGKIESRLTMCPES